MAKHYVRDVNYAGVGSGTYYHNAELVMALIDYHLIRCAQLALGGGDWLWECDGEVGPLTSNPNHVPDGDMALSGTGSWTAIGGTVADLTKDTSEKFSGAQSLKVVSKAVNSGVQSSALLTMSNPTSQTHNSGHSVSGPVSGVMTLNQNVINYTTDMAGCRITIAGCTVPGNNGTFNVKRASGFVLEYYNSSGGAETLSASVTSRTERKYELVIWAKNASGVAWDVKVDRGDAAYTTVGTIPSDGVFKAYHFSFYKLSTGNVYVQVVDPGWTTDHTIYINGMNVFRSFFEYWVNNIYGTDGGVSGTSTFDTGTHTPDPNNVGRYLIFWDNDYPDNTGCYKITGISGGDYQVDLRSGSMIFTTHASGDIPWRIIDLDCQRFFNYTLESGSSAYAGMGVGFQSPHSSGWRGFFRLSVQAISSRERHWIIWASPEDTDFNLSTGFFYPTGPSSLRRDGMSTYVREAASQHYMGGVSGNGSNTDPSSRLFVMTDDDVSFITHICYAPVSAQHNGIFIGYTGADPDHPGVEEFLVMAPFGTPDSGTSTIGVDDGTDNAVYSMTTFSPEEYGVRAAAGALGYGASTASVIAQSNACPNPFSSEEHIDPLLIVRDPDGTIGCPSERELTVGLYMGRTNLTVFATFDTGNYLHFAQGWIWDWNGATLV